MFLFFCRSLHALLLAREAAQQNSVGEEKKEEEEEEDLSLAYAARGQQNALRTSAAF